MSVLKIEENICFVRFSISPNEIPGLLRRHAENYPGAAGLEGHAARLVSCGFQPSDVANYLDAVVRWGGGQRFVGRLLDQNNPTELSIAVREAYELTNEDRTAGAVSRLQQMRYLGQSFASKVVRFLAPTRAVILDEVIRSALGYRESQAGYEEFLEDCRSVLTILTSHHSKLRICDVEAAIFAKIQGY